MDNKPQKPCPFCGGTADYIVFSYTKNDGMSAICLACSTEFILQYPALWDNRPHPDEMGRLK